MSTICYPLTNQPVEENDIVEIEPNDDGYANPAWTIHEQGHVVSVGRSRVSVALGHPKKIFRIRPEDLSFVTKPSTYVP